MGGRNLPQMVGPPGICSFTSPTVGNLQPEAAEQVKPSWRFSWRTSLCGGDNEDKPGRGLPTFSCRRTHEEPTEELLLRPSVVQTPAPPHTGLEIIQFFIHLSLPEMNKEQLSPPPSLWRHLHPIRTFPNLSAPVALA